MKTNIMVDIETLGTEPDAVVLSIAALTFSAAQIGYQTFYRKMQYQGQLEDGRSVTESTIAFWMAQPKEAQESSFRASEDEVIYHPLEVLIQFDRWVASLGNEDAIFWAKPPSFDMVILNSLFGNWQLATPWDFRQWRDVRTAVDIAGIPKDWEPDAQIQGVAHHPLYDCRWQAAQVQACFRKLCVRCGTWDF